MLTPFDTSWGHAGSPGLRIIYINITTLMSNTMADLYIEYVCDAWP